MLRSSNRATGESTANRYQELFALLGDDEDQAARHYVLLRTKLITYFEGRRISPAEDYADEVFHRTAAKIGAGEKVEDINRYVFGIARFVRLESYRKTETETIDENHSGIDNRPAKLPDALIVDPRLPDDGSATVMHACLSECLRKLDDDKRQLILDYYEADEGGGKHIEHRRRLAERYGKSAGALQKQICLLRQKVSGCANDCVRRELN